MKLFMVAVLVVALAQAAVGQRDSYSYNGQRSQQHHSWQRQQQARRADRNSNSGGGGDRTSSSLRGFQEQLAREQDEIQQFQRQLNQTVTQLRGMAQRLDEIVVANPGQVPEACSQLPVHFQQMYNDVTFVKARTETIGLELRSRVDNLWVHSGQEFARIQQQLQVLIEDRDNVPRAVHFLVSLHHAQNVGASPQTVRFDQQMDNMADGYDQHSGHFRCPISGIYIFNIGVSVVQGSNVQVKLLHDGATRVQLQLDQIGQMKSAGVSLKCDESENVWVEVVHQSSNAVRLGAESYVSGALVSSLEQ